MNENDFLYIRQEKMSENFGNVLWQQLQEQDKKHLPKTAIWTVVAASFVTSIIGFLLVLSQITLELPADTPTFTQHDVITVSNIDQLQPFARLGNGMVHQIQAMPDGEHLLIAASTGLFLHDADDLNAEPTQIASDSLGYIDVDEQGNIYGITSLPNGTNNHTQIVLRWDATTYERTELFQRPQNIHHINGLSIKPDGSQMLVPICTEMAIHENFNWRCTEQQFVWYDIASGQQLAVDHPNIYDGVMLGQYAIADDWSYIAYFVDVDDDPETYIFHLDLIDIATHEIRTVLISDAPPPHMNHAAALNGLMFSADGKRLMLQAIGMAEQAIIMDTATLWATDEPINFWLDDEAVLYQTAENDDTFIWGYLLSPDGRSLIAQSNDSLFSYDLADDVNLSLNPSRIVDKTVNQYFIFAPNGQAMYGFLYGGKVVSRYDTSTLEVVDTLTHYDSHYDQTFQFTADGSQVGISEQYNDIPSIWTIDTDTPTRELFLAEGQLRAIRQFTLSPDGKRVVYHYNEFWSNDYSLAVEDIDNNTRHTIDATSGFHNLRFLPDGTLSGLRSYTGLVRYSVDDLTSDQPNPQINRLSTPGLANTLFSLAGISRVTVSPDNQWVVVSRCHREGSCAYTDFIVWDIENDEHVTLVTDEAAFKDYGTMAFSPDSQLFAYAYCLQSVTIVEERPSCASSEVRIYAIDDLLAHESTFTDPIPLEPLATLTGFDELPMNIAFNPQQQADGSWLLAITEWHTQTQLWQVDAEGRTARLRVLDTVRQPVAFDPTGGFMFTTADTAQPEVWGVPLIETSSP